MTSLTASPEITSSITLPNISRSTEDNGILEFQVDNVNTSVANAIRRTMLSDIPCFVFKTFPDSDNQATIHKNTCRFHNEILKQRLGCIPIYIKDLDTPVENLRVIIKVKNDTDSIRYVTTNDFKILDTQTGKYLSDSEVSGIFPPSGPPANGFILFTRLRPKISASIPGEEVDIESKISISSAKNSGMYNTCSTATYFMTSDPIKQNSEWASLRDSFEEKGFTTEEIDKERQNWFLLDAKRFVKKDSFIFKGKIYNTIFKESVEEKKIKPKDLIVEEKKNINKYITKSKKSVIELALEVRTKIKEYDKRWMERKKIAKTEYLNQ